MFKYIFICLTFSYLVQAQVMWQIKSDTTQKWYLQESDEFNSDKLKTTLWNYGYPWGQSVMNLDLLYKNENVLFNKGYVDFVLKKEKTVSKVNEWDIDKKYLEKYNKSMLPNNQYEFDYTGGAISSVKKYRYGYFEVRCKINSEKGSWPAFWLYGGNPNDEIDFIEAKGERDNQIHVDVHCPKGCEDYKGGFLNLQKNWGAWIKTNESLSDDWNIISGEWQPGYVKFFLNGTPIGYFEGDFKSPQNIILNNAVAKNNEAFGPGPDDNTKWPNSFLVDYMRVWSKEDTIDRLKNNYKFFQRTNESVNQNNLYGTELKKKVKYVYNNKALKHEVGTITLLPILYNQFSLSICGRELGKIQIDVIDNTEKKVMGVAIENTEYYILDLGALPTGPYKLKIQVAGQTLLHEIPVINPNKIGEQ